MSQRFSGVAEVSAYSEEDGALYEFQQFTYDVACSLIPLASGIYYFPIPNRSLGAGSNADRS